MSQEGPPVLHLQSRGCLLRWARKVPVELQVLVQHLVYSAACSRCLLCAMTWPPAQGKSAGTDRVLCTNSEGVACGIYIE